MSKRKVIVFGLVVLLSAFGGHILQSTEQFVRPAPLPTADFRANGLNVQAALAWNTFLGGAFEDRGSAIVMDGSGNVYVVGTSDATWGAPVRPYAGNGDAFVAKLNANGVLQWNSFLGGTSGDYGYAVALDGGGNVYVVGTSNATWGSPVIPFAGNADAFVAKLDGSGALQWNTFLGSSSAGFAAAVDTGGNVYVAGMSYATWGSPVRPYAGNGDAFAAKLNGSGALQWNTFLGAAGYDTCHGLAMDPSGNVFVAGESSATWGSPVRPYSGYGAGDAFAAKLNGSGALQWNTFLGSASFDSGRAIALDTGGNVYLSGQSFAGWGAPVRPFSGDYDAFAAKLNGSGALQWNTFLGGSDYDESLAMTIDAGGNVYVAGRSEATWGSPGRSYAGGGDAFAAKLNGSGVLQANIFLGGVGYDDGCALALDTSGRVCLAGSSNASWGSPVRPFVRGNYDAYVAKAAIDGTITPAIFITSPNGAESWDIGSSHNITWTTEGTVGNVKIEYSIDNGSNYTTIAASASNSGSYLWTVPYTPSDASLVKISQASGGTPSDVSDATFTIKAAVSPSIKLSRTNLNLGFDRYSWYYTPSQKVMITNSGGGTMNWKAAAGADWISVTPLSGTGDGIIEVGLNSNNAYYLGNGIYSGTITVSDPNAVNSPRKIIVSVTVTGYYGSTSSPFGEFGTPIDGSTGITGAIPVTGWALDDIAVTKVVICRDAVPSDPSSVKRPDGLVPIGDAIFVEGARPDVEQAYPDFPLNYQAGWGYMLLTNGLPNQGNGTFKIYAIAQDREYHTPVTLGTKTITCDNAHAVKPFGAIDTPSQGGTADGELYLNYGWVLTPQPNEVPKDGSTISVWLDGVNLGNPVYNLYRSDVTAGFPGLKNTAGPVGYYVLDTTRYANGAHMIWWVASDSGGNADGIGSRYFNIVNTGVTGTAGRMNAAAIIDGNQNHPSKLFDIEDILGLPLTFEPLLIRTGFNLKARPVALVPDNVGVYHVEIPEVNRIEIELGSGPGSIAALPVAPRYKGYLIVGDELRPLPVGSTLDARTGRFSWLPGPGFVGTYEMVFLREDGLGLTKRIPIGMTIKPKF